MTKSLFKSIPFCILPALLAAFAPAGRAQSQGTATRITTVPAGLSFLVDGQSLSGAVSPIWATGSKHTLEVAPPTQVSGDGTRYEFQGWETSAGALPGNPATVTGDPAVTEYRAVFSSSGFALSIRFFRCDTGLTCANPPGTVTVNGTPYTRDTTVFMAGNAVLTATPNAGSVFGGWQTPFTAAGQLITSGQLTVNVDRAMAVEAIFLPAQPISFYTDPPGLAVYVDRLQMVTPAVVEWGAGTAHAIGAVTPQMDHRGSWVFSSWSDGGAPTHAVQLPVNGQQFTATYVPGASVAIATSPFGLHVKVDGHDLPAPYYYLWGLGQTHHLDVAAQQIDTQGKPWQFTGWSNGAAATAQDFTVPDAALDGGATLTANFSPLGRLTVNSAVSGFVVTVDGAACAIPCDLIRPIGTKVLLNAPASIPAGDGARQDFLGWSNGPAAAEWTVTLGDDPIAISPNYHLMNRLSAAAAPPEGASWKMAPASPDGFYDSQTTVDVSVAALPGYRFHRWTGDLSGTAPNGSLAMLAPRAIVAQLDKVPYIAPAGVSNAAGVTPQAAVAPGSVVSLYGASLASDTATGPDSPLAQTLVGATVRIGDRLLPLYFVSPVQINFELPADIPEGPQTLLVSALGLSDVRADFNVVRNAPGLFQQLWDGQAYAVTLHEDGSLVTPDSPARRGELLTVYGTGFGPTDPLRTEGFAIPKTPPFLLRDAARVLAGDAVIVPESAFAVPGRVGIDAVQFRLGDGTPSATNLSFHLTVNGQDSNTLLLPVE
ncbi:MAG: hypothetical protein LAP87_12380 [Acidobacteriia bacterium]|nr:hypothetical protein [Terriglobia bacterium]